MNTNNGEGNTEIPVVEDLVIDEADDAEVIKSKVETHNQQVKAYKDWQDNQNSQLYARTKKAEGFVQDASGKWVKPTAPATEQKPADTTQKSPESDSLSQADLLTIVRSNIPEEDIPDVVEYAKFKGISVAEALKSPVVKATLSEKKEARDVAEGTSTGTQRRTTARLSDEALLENAQKGILPESDTDIIRLTNLRRKGKK